MAAPVAASIILPSDAANLGKKKRTQSRVIGPDTVHEDMVVVVSERSVLGVYYAHSGLLTVPTAAHNGTATGHLWLINPVGSGLRMALQRLRETMQFALTTAVDVSVPRTLYSLFTFTGTPSGAIITPARRQSTDAAPVGTLRTASTGMAVTLGANFRGVIPPINATASSATIQANMLPTVYAPWDPDENDQFILRPGEGIVVWAGDASTTANRRLVCDLMWEELEGT